jgi:predicted metal-binding protein
MDTPVRIGIIICDRYKTCAGGKCFKAIKSREGAFSRYKENEIEVVGFTTCNGCPGGNIEYAPEEMIKNGAHVIHLATGFVVGYPPCPYTNYFIKLIESKFNIKVVLGTHPIPQKYLLSHGKLGTWRKYQDKEMILHLLEDESTRLHYN